MGGSPHFGCHFELFVPVDAGGEQVFDIRRLDAAGALPIIIGQILDSQAAFDVAVIQGRLGVQAGIQLFKSVQGSLVDFQAVGVIDQQAANRLVRVGFGGCQRRSGRGGGGRRGGASAGDDGPGIGG